jgi:hypothetical protein
MDTDTEKDADTDIVTDTDSTDTDSVTDTDTGHWTLDTGQRYGHKDKRKQTRRRTPTQIST